ncbi:proline-, glutamic acid- and leucine-rich protein 1 [Anguilla anguilla]|uniref:Proline-, glutamic acid- and leucine-rich protein 1 n=1 Tax=Anguilla anguilla TaxID=7936 RepID=A0A9D3MNG6_ANGAN|nr:proline-, glutamic acid- and leucine-rich protein 1 [Anguilla anguilla]KAG5852121.1 hypothetical protein ANANG_G00059090 [Anguilla anguilla]
MATAVWLHGSSNMRLTEGLVSALKEERPEYLPSLLANYREHGGISTQSSGAAGGLIGLSNARLSSSKTRFEGLCLLSMLVKDSSSEVFQQHCLSWLRSLQQVIQSQAPLPSVQLAVSVLQDLLQYSSQLPELAREVGLNSILGILTSLLGLKSECHLAAMEGMTACMTFYPRACGSLRDKLGAYFLSKMESDNPKVQEVASECYGRLPCLGGVLERGGGGRRAEGWANQLHCLLASAHNILSQLYQGAECERTVQYEGPGIELPFPPLDEADPLLVVQLRHRYRAVCLALKYTLSVDPVSPVRLPVQNVLNLVCRALAVSCKSINLSGDGCLKLLVLPSVHSDTLELLSAVITTVGSGLVPYCSVLTRLFSQTLSAWSPLPEASLGQQRAYSAVRVSLYQTLELWVRVAGASSGVLQGSPTHTELLMAHLLGDITPGADAVKLRVGQAALSELMGHAGKTGPRRGKGLGMGDGSTVSLQRKGDALANQDTCLSALRALRQIILTSGTLLKEDIHKRLQDLVLPLCVRLQQQLQCGGEVGGVSGQYGNAPPRRELYRLLLAMVLAPPPRWPPPLTCAVSIFSHGRKDRNLSVSSFCAEALTVCNSLLHPRTPSLAPPLPPLTLKHTATAPTLTPSQNPSLSLPSLLGGPAQGAPFPARHPLSLGPTGLLGPLENHLPLPPSVLPPQAGSAPTPGDLLLSTPQPGELAALGAPEGHRPVFVRYDKEEAEDVEISLESDSDDSVVIVPQGMLMVESHDAASTQPLPPPGGAVATVGTGAAGDTGVVSSPLPNELPASMPHQILPANSNAINTFPGQSQAQLVSVVPQLNSTASQLAPPPVGLGDSLPSAQLQQMLMQPSPAGQPSQLGLPMQMQLQNQMAQSSRQLQQQQQQQQQQQMPSEEDLTVININSSDEEEEEDEEMEDEDDLGEEDEEEEEGLEDEEEEEEGSDFQEEDEYYGEEFDDYEDEEEGMIEAEEMEEEPEGLPPLEGESRRALMNREEGGVLMSSADERGMGIFRLEREGEGDAELEGVGRGLEGDHGVYRQPLDSTEGDGHEGLKEEGEREVRVTEEGKDKIEEGEHKDVAVHESKGDSQPQGPAEEVIEEASEFEKETGVELGRLDQTSQEQGPTQEGDGATVDETAVSHQEGEVESLQEVRMAEEKEGVELTSEQPRLEEEEKAKQDEDVPVEEVRSPRQGEEGRASVAKDDVEEEGEDDLRGMKRKREEHEVEGAEQSVEKKKLDEEAMASMLADFVDCPPDEDDNAHSTTHS